ncbi:hypothetical protein GCM10009638_06250 [Luteococcus sanguinis]
MHIDNLWEAPTTNDGYHLDPRSLRLAPIRGMKRWEEDTGNPKLTMHDPPAGSSRRPSWESFPRVATTSPTATIPEPAHSELALSSNRPIHTGDTHPN